MKGKVENVSDTAFLVARFRAIESERPDALFRDPLADVVSGERGRAIVDRLGRRAGVGCWSIAVRTVIIDDYLRAEIAAGADTVLSLGAGLDTRPYRLGLPAALRWIEVDYPHVIELKESRLAGERASCAIERVKLDLADVPARRRLFADVAGRSKRLVVLTEGVVPYLGVDDVGALADDLCTLAPARAWIVDYFSPKVLRYRRRVSRQFANAPFKFQPSDWLGFFAAHGWRPRERRFLAVEGARRGRRVPLPLPVRLFIRLRRALVRGRRDGLEHFAGYFLMEPTGETRTAP